MKKVIKKIFISGSSGQIGSYLFEYFSKKYEVTGLDVKKSGIPIVDKRTILGDIRDKNIISKMVKKVDVVIHTASQLNIQRSLENPPFDADVNILGTLNVLNAARENKKILKFIYLSTSAVYGEHKYLPIDENHPLNPVSPYGLSKLTAEKYSFLFHKIFDLPIVCVRPFNIYSRRENPRAPYISLVSRFVNNAKNNKPLIIHGTGKQKRDFVHVNDIVTFIDIILNREDVVGEIYNVGSGHPIQIIDLAKSVLNLYGKNEMNNIQFEDEEKGAINHSYADITKSRKIGYNALVTIEAGIKEIMGLSKK
ncbi:MAG: NAD-dependent epimerase/dehydratase family protein [Euryarchaeota archaeon]|nr:NAD-dependent epimerase/dehydratase family protein [Euryarchaeota archaeon]